MLIKLFIFNSYQVKSVAKGVGYTVLFIIIVVIACCCGCCFFLCRKKKISRGNVVLSMKMIQFFNFIFSTSTSIYTITDLVHSRCNCVGYLWLGLTLLDCVWNLLYCFKLIFNISFSWKSVNSRSTSSTYSTNTSTTTTTSLSTTASTWF